MLDVDLLNGNAIEAMRKQCHRRTVAVRVLLRRSLSVEPPPPAAGELPPERRFGDIRVAPPFPPVKFDSVGGDPHRCFCNDQVGVPTPT
jgi:hypothetical protein